MFLRSLFRRKPPTIAEMIDPNGPICSCGSGTIDAPGIGHYCPNKACPVKDGPFDGSPPPRIRIVGR